MDGQVMTYHTATMINTQAIIIVEIIRTNLEMSFSIGVGVGLSSLDSFAIWLKTVELPVATTTPMAVPDTQCVP